MYIYHIQWFENPFRSHVAFSSAYIFVQSVIFAMLVSFKFRWIAIIIGLLIPTGVDLLLLDVNILILSRNWNIFDSILIRIIVLCSLFLIDRCLLKSYSLGLAQRNDRGKRG